MKVKKLEIFNKRKDFLFVLQSGLDVLKAAFGLERARREQKTPYDVIINLMTV